MSDQTANRLWRNWVGNQSFAYERLIRPRDEAEVVDLVTELRDAGETARVTGAGHSFTPLVQTDDVLMDLGELHGLSGVDRDQRVASVLPATTIAELGPQLWERGVSLLNEGDIDTQTIAGAVATGTHGSGRRFGSLSAAVCGGRIVTGRGDAIEIGPDTPDQLHALQVSLGMLGIVTELRVAVTDAYCLHELNEVIATEEVLERWDTLLDRRHFSFFWLPADGSAALYQLETPDGTDRAGNCYVKLYDQYTPAEAAQIQVAAGQRLDRAYAIYPHVFEPDWVELEYMVAIEHAKEAFLAVRDLARHEHPEQAFPIEVRFTRADEGYLSPNYGTDTAVFSITSSPDVDYSSWFGDFDAVLAAYGARAHWGKLHLLDRERIAQVYPRYDDFCRVRAELDPDEIWLNEYLRPLFGR